MSAAAEPVSPAAVVTVALLRAVGVSTVHEARALLREAIIWQIPRMSGANVAEVLAAFAGADPAVPAQRGDHAYAREIEPGTEGTGRPWSGARHGDVVDDEGTIA